MKPFELFVSIGLFLIAAETSYLVWAHNRDARRKTSQEIFVDTSVLMDGRILSIAQAGFITDTLVVPRSVVAELQLLADKSDHEKRLRARYGLDVVRDLQAMDNVDVFLLQDGAAKTGVDDRLLELAKKRGGALLTIDFNLTKVAEVEDIKVLNINQLAQQLRMAHLPGEKMTLELVEKGQDSHQAVGYLPDGTMVVVEHASAKLGQKVTVECIRSLQTVAGKMMFGRLLNTPDHKTNSARQKLGSSKGRAPQSKSISKKTTQAAPENLPTKSTPQSADSNVREVVKSAPKKSTRPKTSSQREDSLLRAIDGLSNDE